MDKHLLHGDSVSDDQIQAWAGEAEAAMTYPSFRLHDVGVHHWATDPVRF